MAETLVRVKESPAAATREKDLGLRGDFDHATRRAPARERVVMYGPHECMGQMEFITPEEIARQAVLEIKGSNTGDEGSAAVTRETYPYDGIRLGAVVAWIFNNEILGYRIK